MEQKDDKQPWSKVRKLTMTEALLAVTAICPSWPPPKAGTRKRRAKRAKKEGK